MKDRNRILLLITIMIFAVILVGGASMMILYGTALSEERAHLVEAAQSQARLMEAIADFNAIYNQGFNGSVEDSTLSQIRAAHEEYQGFGETGEFTLAKREGDWIVFLLRHRNEDLLQPEPIAFQSDLAEPMRRALMEESGSMIGLDYKGNTVLAAYEPVSNLDMGIVAKIDMTEIRAPFIRSGFVSGLVMTVVVLVTIVIFWQVSDPILVQLAANEKRFRELYNHMSSGVSIYKAQGDGENFIINDINLAGERISDVERDDVIGKLVTEVFPGIKEMGLFDALQQVWRTGELVSFSSKRYKDQRISKWLDNQVYRLPSGELVAVYNDVSEKIHTEAALRLQSTIVANMSESVNLVRADDGILLYTNPKMEETFGYAPGELIGKHVSILNAPTDKKTASETSSQILTAIQDKGSWDGEVYNIKKDGSTFWCYASVTTFDHPEYGKTIVSVQSDITERKIREAEKEQLMVELEAKNKEMESFTYSVSHDMKSPLISLDGFSAALQREEHLSDQGRHYLDRIRANVAYMNKLTSDILGLSRIGRVVGEQVQIDVLELIGKIQDEMEFRLDDINFEIQEPLLKPFGDRLRIHQIFSNLIDNAVKFQSPNRGLIIKVGSTPKGDMIQFQVCDNGIGIPPQHLERIFNLFHQLQFDKPGVGMGLTFVKKIVEYHGGQIWVESIVGEGSTFYFTLPGKRTDYEPTAH